MHRIRTIALAALLILATIGAAAPVTASAMVPKLDCLANPSACL
ncbi:MAG TPA: hypothetical protein VGR57_02075 [Ktedonobacterales bacterium]|nr:hypothetical protein [Ktedonobacterales bacterium]